MTEAGARWQPPAGWYTDPGGLHEWRWWDGSRWADTVSDGGVATNDELDDIDAVAQLPPGPPPLPPPPPPPPVRSTTGGEVLLFIVYLIVWLCGIGILGSVTNGGNYIGFLVWFFAIMAIAGKLGYRWFDAFMMLIPLWNAFITVKLLWRLTHIQRPYWAPAPAS